MKKIIRFFRAILPSMRKESVILGVEVVLEIAATGISVLLPLQILQSILYESSVTQSLRHIFVWISMKVLVDLLRAGVKKKAEYERKLINYRIQYHLSESFLNMTYAKTQDAECLDKKSGACFSVEKYQTVTQLLQAFGTIFSQSCILVLGGSYLLLKHPVLLLILLLNSGIQYGVNQKLNETLGPYFGRLFPINRRFDWLNQLKLDLGRQKDLRVFRMEDMILQKIAHYNQETCDIFQEMNDITYKSNLRYQVPAEVLRYLSYFYNGFCVLAGKISFGEFLMLNELMGTTTQILGSIGDTITSAFQMLTYMEPVIELLQEREEVGGDKEVKEIEEIEFCKVSFRYPYTEHDVLKDISFRVKKGERIGIVGLNGSGKTTLVKLLCGLYLPTQGSILINGKALTEYNIKKYQKKISAVFQDFKLFDLSVSENVVLQEKRDKQKLEEIFQELDILGLLKKLPNDVDTNLGTQTYADGVDLSGGERQKLAIARAMYRKGELFLFDEPNASLDPVSEAQTYQQYNEMIQDNIAFFVSHKMISTYFCTKLLVLEEGVLTGFERPEVLLENESSLFHRLYWEEFAMFRKEKNG